MDIGQLITNYGFSVIAIFLLGFFLLVSYYSPRSERDDQKKIINKFNGVESIFYFIVGAPVFILIDMAVVYILLPIFSSPTYNAVWQNTLFYVNQGSTFLVNGLTINSFYGFSGLQAYWLALLIVPAAFLVVFRIHKVNNKIYIKNKISDFIFCILFILLPTIIVSLIMLIVFIIYHFSYVGFGLFPFEVNLAFPYLVSFLAICAILILILCYEVSKTKKSRQEIGQVIHSLITKPNFGITLLAIFYMVVIIFSLALANISLISTQPSVKFITNVTSISVSGQIYPQQYGNNYNFSKILTAHNNIFIYYNISLNKNNFFILPEAPYTIQNIKRGILPLGSQLSFYYPSCSKNLNCTINTTNGSSYLVAIDKNKSLQTAYINVSAQVPINQLPSLLNVIASRYENSTLAWINVTLISNTNRTINVGTFIISANAAGFQNYTLENYTISDYGAFGSCSSPTDCQTFTYRNQTNDTKITKSYLSIIRSDDNCTTCNYLISGDIGPKDSLILKIVFKNLNPSTNSGVI